MVLKWRMILKILSVFYKALFTVFLTENIVLEISVKTVQMFLFRINSTKNFVLISNTKAYQKLY